MPRTVVVLFHPTAEGEPVEVGRATLDASNRAVISGFPKDIREEYQTDGIYDPIGISGERGAMVRIDNGDVFLTVLLREYSGSRTTAKEL